MPRRWSAAGSLSVGSGRGVQPRRPVRSEARAAFRSCGRGVGDRPGGPRVPPAFGKGSPAAAEKCAGPQSAWCAKGPRWLRCVSRPAAYPCLHRVCLRAHKAKQSLRLGHNLYATDLGRTFSFHFSQCPAVESGCWMSKLTFLQEVSTYAACSKTDQ